MGWLKRRRMRCPHVPHRPLPPAVTTPALLRARAGLPSRRDAKLLLPDSAHTQLAEADGSDRSYHSLSLIS